MTTGKALVLAAAVAVLPGARALAGSLTLRAGAAYTQSDAWSATGATSTEPRLDVDLGLNLSGVIVSRDVVAYRAEAQYRRLSEEANGVSTNWMQAITYQARAALLNNAVSPVALNLSGGRSEVDFATSPGAAVYGHGLTTTAGADVSFRLRDVPTLSASYALSETEQFIPGDDELYEATVHSLGSSVSFGTTAFQAAAQYSGQFRDGTWVADDVTAHDVAFSAYVPLGGQTISIESLSAFTIPDQLIDGAYEQQSSSFRIGYSNNGNSGDLRAVSYSYSHSLVETSTTPVAELAHQGIRYTGDHLLTSPTLFTRWLLDASLAEVRSGDAEVRSTGETLGAELWWREGSGATTYEVAGGPRVGLRQSDTGDTTGFGANGRVKVLRPLWGHSLHFEYSATYSTELFAQAGWQLSQSLAASLSGRTASSRFDTTIRGSAFRTSSPVTGAGAGRSLEASARWIVERLQLDARVSLQSGMVGATPDKFVGDGLFLPAPFDSSTLDGSLGMSLRLFSGLSGHLRARAASQEGPGRPTLRQVEAIAGLTYSYGAFGLSVDDRITRVENSVGWDTGNILSVRVYRMLSW